MKKTRRKIANTFIEAVFVREDLDQIVDKKIEEYFEKEESRETLSSYIKLPLDMGYKKGFYFQTHDGKFRMKMNGRIQFTYSFEDFDRKDDDSSFRLRRARLKWTGHAYRYFKYKIELALKSTGSKDRSKSVELIGGQIIHAILLLISGSGSGRLRLTASVWYLLKTFN